MRKITLAIALIASLFALPADADFTAKDAALATITFKNPAVCTSVVCVPVVQLYDGTNVVTLTTAGADAVSNTLTGVPVYGRNFIYNGTTWDRWLGDATNGGFVNVKTSVLPTGASTAAKQPALGTAGAASVDVLTVQGIASMTPFLTNPGTAANWGIVTTTQNSASATLGQMVLGQFNTTPTTITTGNMSPLQMDSAGNLLVNIKAGAGSGGTAIVDNSAFTQSTTNETPAGCLFNTAYAAATSGRSTVLRCLSDGSAFTNAAFWAGTALGAPSAYGTSPGAVNVPGVNAFVTNSNVNGRAVSGSSSPVVPTPALSTWHLIAAASTNATSVKGSAATVFSCQLGGIAGPAFLKIYNKATAPTVGTDVPVKTLIIPVASTAANGAGSNISFGPGGLTLATGFAAAVTGVITDADTTAVAAASFAINCDYE